MKTRNNLFIIGLICTWLCLPFAAKAQVTIGAEDVPNESAVLELKASDKGLLLPRVELTSTTSFAPLKAHVEGMTVYNAKANGTGATAVVEGIY